MPWIKCTNADTAAIRIQPMSEEVWLSTTSKAEVSQDVYDVLVTIDDFEPTDSSNPGTVRTSAPNHIVQVALEDAVVSSLDVVGAASVDELSVGDDPGHTISETSSPKSFTFSASDNRDIHDSTDVTLSNPSSSSVTEDVTVEYYDGSDSTGTLVDSETRSITLASGTSGDVNTFLTSDFTIDTGEYHISVSTSGSTFTVDRTDEHTIGAKYTTKQTATGELETYDHYGNLLSRFDPLTGEKYVPRHRADVSNVKELSVGSEDTVSSYGTGISVDSGALTSPQSSTSDIQWSEDGNSPHTYSGVNTTTYTLAGEYDMVLVVFDEHVPSDGSGMDHSIRLNGDTGSNYWWYTPRDGAQSGDTEITIATTTSGSHRVTGSIRIDGRWTGGCNVANRDIAGSARGQALHEGYNSTISSPLTSFTILESFDSANFSGELRVYGRDT